MKRTLWAAVGIEGKDQTSKTTLAYKLARLEIIRNKLLEIYNVTIDEFTSSSRKGELVYIRQLFCYICAKLYGDTSIGVSRIRNCPTRKEIGLIINAQYDRTTVIHCIQTFQNRLDHDTPLPKLLTYRQCNTVQDYNNTSEILKQCL